MKIDRRYFLIFIIFIFGCREPIVHDLTELDANRLFAQLHSSEISPKKLRQPDGNWTISVPSNSVFKAIKLLDSQRYFKKTAKTQTHQKSLLSSAVDQQLAYVTTLSQQLEDTISSLSGVFESHVHLNLAPQKSIWTAEVNLDSATASVLVIVDQDFKNSETEIKKIVTGAVGIGAEKISVVLNKLDTHSESESLEIIATDEITTKTNNLNKHTTETGDKKLIFIIFSVFAVILAAIIILRRRQYLHFSRYVPTVDK